jgi:hypothetical protein
MWLASCGSDTAQPLGEATTAAPSTTDAKRSPFSTAQLIAFRDAAAEAPFWATVDRQPPTTLEEVCRNTRRAVAVGTVQSVRLGEPRPDGLKPYEGAPTLYHLEVVLRVTVDDVLAGGVRRGSTIEALIPVSSGGIAIVSDDRSRSAADRITATAPVGAPG